MVEVVGVTYFHNYSYLLHFERYFIQLMETILTVALC